MSKIVQGKNVILKFWDGTAYLPVGCLTTNSINESQDITEGEPNKCDTSTPKSQGAYTYEISGDAVMIALDDTDYATKAHYEKLRTLWAASRTSGEAINWAMEGSNIDYYGEGFITELSAEYPTDGSATFTIGISGIGEVSLTDPLV
jgi:predicted secreted protein